MVEYVRLISSDGFEFTLPKDCALNSGTLRSMLSSPGQFAENLSNEVHLRDIKYSNQLTFYSHSFETHTAT